MGEPTKTKKEQRILQIISKDLIRTLRSGLEKSLLNFQVFMFSIAGDAMKEDT